MKNNDREDKNSCIRLIISKNIHISMYYEEDIVIISIVNHG